MPPRKPSGRFDQVRVIANAQEGLYVTDAKGGKMQVFACNIALRAGKPPVMQMNLVAQTFNVEGVPTILVQDPRDGLPKAVKRIEWWGSVEAADFPEPATPDVAMQPPAGGAKAADPPGAAPITPAAANANAE